MSRKPTTAERALLRTQPFRSKLYMVIEKGTSLFTAKVDDDTIEEGETVITYDAQSGEDDVLGQMTLFNKALDEIGNEKGSARIKSINTGTNKITIEPNSIDWEDNEDLLVDGVLRLYRILPKITSGVVEEDYDKTYTNQNDNDKRKPVALMGSPRYAWAGEPIDFYGWRSYAKARDGAGKRYKITAYAWNFDGGNIVSGAADEAGMPSSPNWVKWNTPGERHVRLKVTDGNGNTHRAYRPVIVVDRPGQGESPPYEEFEVELLEGDWDSGDWRASITVTGDATAADFPNNALAILFCEDWYGETKQSIGGWFGQEDILLCAFVIEDSVRQDAETGDVTFEIASIVNQLKEIDVWPLNFKNVDGAPGGWHEFQDMTVEDVFWHIVEEHTTLKNIADVFIWTGVSGGKRIDFIDITEGAVYDQLDQQLLSAIFGHLTSSRYSSVHGNRNFNMLNLDQRLRVGKVMMKLQKRDRLDDLEIAGERHRDAVCQVDFIGFIYNSDGDPIEVYSLAPENQKNFGRVEKQTGILLTGSTIAAAQDEADELAGLYLAHQNICFPSVTVKLGNYRVFDPAHQDLVGLRVEPTDTPRGYDWWDSETREAKEFIVRRVSYEIDQKAGHITGLLGLEASTWGKDGRAGPYPPVPPPPEPDDVPPPWPPPPPPEPWRKKVYVATKVNGIYYTETYSAPGGDDPIWWTVNDGLGALTTRCIVGDPWVPAYRQYTRTAEPKIYRRENGGSWGVILDATIVGDETGVPVDSSLGIVGPKCNINAQGHVYALLRYHDGSVWRLYFFWSDDYGANWTPTLILTSIYPVWDPRELLVGAFQGTSPYAAGQVIYIFYKRNGVGDTGMRVSVNQGGEFGAQIDFPYCGSSVIGQHFSRSPADQDILYRVIKGSTADPANWMRMDKSPDRGSTWPISLFACTTFPPNPNVAQRPGIYIWDPDSAYMAGGGAGLHWTEDDWNEYVTHTNTDNFDVDGCSRVMDSPEYLYGWRAANPGAAPAMQHVIAVSEDRGDGWEGKAGDDPVTPSSTSIPNDCGGVAGILQIWTE